MAAVVCLGTDPEATVAHSARQIRTSMIVPTKGAVTAHLKVGAVADGRAAGHRFAVIGRVGSETRLGMTRSAPADGHAEAREVDVSR